jgi:DNA/RNA-binding domain of Phe-tRNA-synthetase-like protein
MLELQVELPIQVVLIEAENLTITKYSAAFTHLVSCAEDYHRRYASSHISQVPGVAATRQLFRALKIEPTKHRPSSEALLRRALKQLPFYSVNNLVDVCNWFALETQSPNGVYDRDMIKPPITLRCGLPGEEYLGHNEQPVHLAGRYALVDQRGVFGSPITDSQRTAVTQATKAVLVVVYAPADYDEKQLWESSNRLAERIKQFCGGNIVQNRIIRGK